MIPLSPSLEKLITEIAKLPGLGRKSAARLALFILRQSEEDAQRLADSILDVKRKIHLCSVCANLTEEDTCSICQDPKRDHNLICVVETPGDVITLEKTGVFRGLYHVLGGAMSPLDGIGPHDLRVKELFDRVKIGTVREVILATNPTPEGDATALFLAHELNEKKIPVSRIARGVPIGAELENVDEVTLARALEGRTNV